MTRVDKCCVFPYQCPITPLSLRQGQGMSMARHWAGTWPREQLKVTVTNEARRCPKYKCSRLETSAVLCAMTFEASNLLLAWSLCWKGLFWVLVLWQWRDLAAISFRV